MPKSNKVIIPVINSINTDSINEDIKTLGAVADVTPHVQNTGIERNGGISNLYETEATLPTGNNYVTENGKVITRVVSGDTATILIDGVPLSTVSAYGVESSVNVLNCADALALDSVVSPAVFTGGYMTLNFVAGVATVTRFNKLGVQTDTRNITFTGLGVVASVFTSINFIRWQNIRYTDSLEFIVRVGPRTFIIKESNPSQSITPDFFVNSTVLGATTAINTMVVYGNYLVVAGASGRVGSYDPIAKAWRNYDGTGAGSGPFNAGTAIVANQSITASCVFASLLVFGTVDGKICFYDGSGWTNYNATGSGTTSVANNSTALGAATGVNAMVVYNNNLVVAGTLGRVAQYNFVLGQWQNYNDATADLTTPCSGGSVTSSITITSLTVRGTTLIYGANATIGSFDYSQVSLKNFSPQTSFAYPGAGTGWKDGAYGNGLYAIIAHGISVAELQTSPDGAAWSTAATIANGNWNSICYGTPNNVPRFVAVGSGSAPIGYGSTAINNAASTIPAPSGAGLISVAYGAGTYVAVSASTSVTNTVYTSTDGVTWLARTSTASGTGGWKSVTYSIDLGLFVCVGGASATTTGCIQTSPNGVVWTARTSPQSPSGASWNTVGYGTPNNGFLFVAISAVQNLGVSNFACMTSPDGITWTGTNSGFNTFPNTALGAKIVFSNGWFMALLTTTASARFVYSNNGTTWNITSTNSNSVLTSTALVYGNNKFVSAYSNTAGTTGVVQTSNHEYFRASSQNEPLYYVVATAPKSPSNARPASSGGALSIVYTPTNEVVFSGTQSVFAWNGNYYSNAQGPTSFNSNFIAGAGTSWASIVYGNNQYVAHTTGSILTAGIIQTSPDGVTWSNRTSSAAGAGGWNEVCVGSPAGANLFVMVGGASGTTVGNVQSSIDGGTWTARTLPSNTSGVLSSVAYGNGVFVTMGLSALGTGICYTSPDGITWTAQTCQTSLAGGWRKIVFGNGWFMAVGLGNSTTNSVQYSRDGITWFGASLPSAPTGSDFSMGYGNGTFVLMTTSVATPSIFTTPGPNFNTQPVFTLQTSATSSSTWKNVTYGNGLFSMIGGPAGTTTGCIQTSADGGVTWVSRSSVATTALGLSNLCYGNSQFVAIGGSVAVGTDQYWTDFGLIPTIFRQTGILSGVIQVMQNFNSTLVFAGAAGIGSWDGTNFKNSDGTGTGTGVFQPTGWTVGTTVTDSEVYLGELVFSTNLGYVQGLSSSNVLDLYGGYNLQNNGINIDNLLQNQTELNPVYCWRYDSPYNNVYLHLLTANSLSLAYVVNNSSKAVYQLNAKYAVPQVNGTYSRHILTGTFTVSGTVGNNGVVNGNGNAISIVGFTGFNSTFSYNPIYSVISDTVNAAGVLSQNALMGGIDVTYNNTIAPTSIQACFYPNMINSTQISFVNRLTPNTNTRIDGYGKLTNNYQEPTAKAYEIREGVIAGTASFLSVAVVDTSTYDTLGTLLTNVGEFDGTYIPSIADATGPSFMVYRYSGQFYFKVISKSVSPAVSAVNNKLYKVNTISPNNLVDSVSNTINIGSADYNGRMMFNGGAISSVATPTASVLYQRYSNGIDVGNKLPTSTLLGPNTIQIPGITIPLNATVINYGVDTYINNAYSFTTLSNQTEVVSSLVYNGGGLLVTAPLYSGSSATTLLPIAIGQSYPSYNVTSSGVNTYFLFPGFEGYLFGNQISGTFSSFTINGQTYLFDGTNIYLADINTTTNILNSSAFICSATGLQLLAVSPTTAFFLSAFDNGLFTFMGGRSVDKVKRLVGLPTISQGIFNTRDNTLLLDATGNFIYARDNLWSMTPKKANQTGTLRLYSTTGGIKIGNDVNTWQYSYNSTLTSTVVPLTLQTAYFGQDSNEKSILPNWIVTIYMNPRPTTTVPVFITLRGYDGSTYTQAGKSSFVVENKSITLTPTMCDTAGFIRFMVTSQNMKTVAASLQLQCNARILVQEIVAEFVDDTTQTYADMATV